VYPGTQNGRILCNANELVSVQLGVLCTESIAEAVVHVHECSSRLSERFKISNRNAVPLAPLPVM
jgi:hypothetical protein